MDILVKQLRWALAFASGFAFYSLLRSLGLLLFVPATNGPTPYMLTVKSDALALGVSLTLLIVLSLWHGSKRSTGDV